MSFAPFQDEFLKQLNKKGLGNIARATVVCDHFRELTAALFPEGSEAYIKPKRFKDGCLTVGVADGAWSAAVLEKKEDIIKKLNAKTGENVIKRLKAEVSVFKAKNEQ